MIEVDNKLTATQTLTETMREVWRFRVETHLSYGVPTCLKLVERAMEHRATTRHKWRADERTAWYAYSCRRGELKPVPPPEIIHAVRQRLVADMASLVYAQ